eukprot:TRINITY_DN1039_c0_g1_i11.p1 TRINITY_DN1039_c0_g1~~TRINITY_DN1039_c0_g1_i11.p1  ORF type:complete len:279 (+),score=58.33 TRINITY_DN1039_c0_g1_i11:84-920(+)
MGDCAILGGYPATMTVSGFLAFAGLTGAIVYSQNVASLKGFEGDKGQCKIMAVHREESCKGHDRKKKSGASKEAAKGYYTFDYDVTVLSPEVCPNTTIRYDHTQGSIWCDTVPDHPLDEELACWYEHDCSKVWFKDPDSLIVRKILWLVVSLVGLILCGIIHAVHWCLCCCTCSCCVLFSFLNCREECTTDVSARQDIELPPTPPPLVMKTTAPTHDTETDCCEKCTTDGSFDEDTENPQPDTPHLAGLEWKNVSPHGEDVNPLSTLQSHWNNKWEEV